MFVEGNTHTFVAGAALSKGTRVKISSGKLAAAGATDVYIGWMNERALADGDLASVRLRTASGTVEMVASAAISAGATVELAASGKIATFSAGTKCGVAVAAASGDGSVIEVVPFTGTY